MGKQDIWMGGGAVLIRRWRSEAASGITAQVVRPARLSVVRAIGDDMTLLRIITVSVMCRGVLMSVCGAGVMRWIVRWERWEAGKPRVGRR